MSHEKRQAARVVDVGVREYHGIDMLDRHREAKILLVAIASLSLKHPTIQHDRLSRDAKDVAGPGDLACRANELEFHDSLG